MKAKSKTGHPLGNGKKSCKRTVLRSDEPAILLFGGFEPSGQTLVLTVEAASSQEAHQRMMDVAPLVKVIGADKLEVLLLGKPSRQVPLFMQGHFEAIGWRLSRTAAASLEAF